jgi:hypothetical protein
MGSPAVKSALPYFSVTSAEAGDRVRNSPTLPKYREHEASSWADCVVVSKGTTLATPGFAFSCADIAVRKKAAS